MGPSEKSENAALPGAVVNVSTEIDKIEAIAKKADVEKATVQEKVDAEVAELQEHQASAIPEDQLRQHAISIVKNDLFNITGGSGFGGGEAEELPILTLGFQRKEADYFVTDNNAILGSGIVNPPDDPAGFAVFLIDSGHGVDLNHAGDAFMPLNTVRGYASKRQVGSRDGEPTIKKGGNPVYLINSTDESTFEIVDPDSVPDDDPLSDLPSDREAKRQLIHENFITDSEKATIQTYADHETVKNDNGYELAFGADVKRIRGEVVDSFIFDSGDGTMTVTDDTVFGEEDVPEELIGDQQRTPGLQVSCTGDLVYGENSVLDLYGFIQQRKDGQYKMQALGVIPIVEFEYDGPEGSGNSSNTDDHTEEDTI